MLEPVATLGKNKLKRIVRGRVLIGISLRAQRHTLEREKYFIALIGCAARDVREGGHLRKRVRLQQLGKHTEAVPSYFTSTVKNHKKTYPITGNEIILFL